MRALARAALAAFALAAAAGGAHAQAQEPPLNISADNMSGTHVPEGDVVNLSGNVRITRGRTVITAERGRYIKTQSMLYLEQQVKMVDSTTTVTCDRATYNEGTDVLRLDGNVHVNDRDAVLHAPWATYDRRNGQIELYDGVDASDKTQTMRADSALYLRDSLLLKARGHVRATDKKSKSELTAGAVDWHRGEKEAAAWGDPQLVSREDNQPPTIIRALRMRVNTETRVAQAIDSVTVVRDTLHARSDYAEFDDASNYGILTGSPRAWDGETTVSGDTLQVWADARKLQRAVVQSNARVDYQGRGANAGEKSLLTGDRIDVFFTANDIDSLVAVRGARDHYEAPPREGKTAEYNSAEGDTITVFFVKRKIDRARVEGRASGEYQFAVGKNDTAASAAERVKYDASRIEFQVARNHIVLDPNAHLTYKEIELTSRRVEFDVNKQTLVAEGKPELVESDNKVTGNLMTYDLETRIGNIYRAQTEYEAGLYHGSQIRKVTDNELDVMNGSYSTCDLADPHYHFSARWMKIYMKDKLVAKPVVFYLRNVPVFALPFWVSPIKPGRHSGIMFPQLNFGVNTATGQFIRNAGYYWAPNDYMDLTLNGDYYAGGAQVEPSWVLRTEGNYKLLYVLDGTFNGSLARSNTGGVKTEDWEFDADHTQQLTTRTQLVGRASFVSSREYQSSPLPNQGLEQRFNRFLVSSLAISHSADWASFSGFFERRQDLDADLALQGMPVGTVATSDNLTESLPSVSVSLPTRTAGSIPFLQGTRLGKALSTMYLGFDAKYLSYVTRRGYVAATNYFTDPTDSTRTDSTSTIGQLENTRRGFQSDISVSDARRAFGWLNLQPSFNSTVAVFDQDVLGNKLVPAGVWSAGLSSSASFYGTFAPHLGRLDALRHVVFPSVTLNYSPEFRSLLVQGPNGTLIPRFVGFNGIGVSGYQQFRMGLGLEQRLQVKVRNKDQVQRIDNLLAWAMSSSYDFLYRKNGALHPLSPIGNTITLQPPRYTNASMNFVVDPYNPRPLRTVTYNIGLNFNSEDKVFQTPSLAIERGTTETQPFRDNWNVGLTYSYSGGYSGAYTPASPLWAATRSANAVVSYQLSPSWQAEYSASYDLTLHSVGTQRIALTRDLHCWQAQFTRTFIAGGEAEYYFRIGVKRQSEIYYERGTRNSSFGGIQ